MVKLRDNLKVRPYYISDSEAISTGWSQKFSDALAILGDKYGVDKALQAQVKANNLVIQSIFDNETLLLKSLGEWRSVKNNLYDASASASPVSLPENPEFPAKPEPVSPYIWGAHIQAAEIILANKNLTQVDRETLGLVKAAQKPVNPDGKRRVKADLLDYPYMKFDIENGMVIIRIIRGNKYKGKAILIQVDREGKGNFTALINTTANSVSDTIRLPIGQLTASWTYRAVYVEGDVARSQWSPNQYVNVNNEPPPL